jgi:lysophospholipase L1-like esterase
MSKVINKLKKNGTPVIAALGDSVTRGCFEIYYDEKETLKTVYDTENSYGNLLRKKLDKFFPENSPLIINAGRNGDNAFNGLMRVSEDVLRFSPDLTIVCFGLNDCCRGLEGLKEYGDALNKIFLELQASDSDIVFMTPNMFNTSIYWDIDNRSKELAYKTMRFQQDGTMDEYMETAKRIALLNKVGVCDCYRQWKALYSAGVDITRLLCNRINHPSREMHGLFSDALFELIFDL